MLESPADLPRLQRDRLRAQADMFAAVAAHGTIVGTAREIALIEFFRGLVPRRYEVLSGAVAREQDGRLTKSSSQLDVLIVDTLDYPTLLRTGDLAVVLPESVLAIVEAKSGLGRGRDFAEAMDQIGQAKQVAGSEALTALFCYGDPKQSITLRGWLSDIVTRRRELLASARGATEAARIRILNAASNYSVTNLPDLVLSDGGAIAILEDAPGGDGAHYRFYKAAESSPTIVALASKVLSHVSRGLRSIEESDPRGQMRSYKVLIDHFNAGFTASGDPDLDVIDELPVQE